MKKIDEKLSTRQFQLMKKRFDVDEENKIVKLDLTYESVNELLETNIDTYVPTFDREKFGRIREVISDFPLEYRADLNIKIDNYEGYKPEEVMDGFNDAVEYTYYSGNREHKKKWVQIVFLLIAGILILAFMARGILENWIDNEQTQTVAKEVFDITSWVFIWQAVSLIFLTPSEDRITSMLLSKRLNNVTFRDKDNKVLAQESFQESYSKSVKEVRLRLIGKYMLLITGAAFFALGIYNLVNFFISTLPMIATVDMSVEGAGVMIAVLIFLGVIEFAIIIIEALAGLAAIMAFTGKGGKIYKLVLPFGIIAFLLETIVLVFSIIYGMSLTSPIVSVIVTLGYVLGAIFLLATNEKHPKNKKKKI